MAASFNYETLFDYAGRTKSAAKLENQMSQSDFWNDSDTAQSTVAELKQLNTILKPLDESISAAAQRMTTKKIRKLAVTDNGNIVGLVTSTDLVTQLTK